MLVRREAPGDETAIRAVHVDAFRSAYPEGEPPEPRLVDDLRRCEAWTDELSLVATIGNTITGHVCCTRATLLPHDHQVLGLGPIGVREEHKRQGIGKALMHAVIGAADAMDEPLIVLLGHPDYYPRFGFEPAVPLGIIPPVAEWEPAFQARKLTRYEPSLSGRFRYAQPFNDL